MADDDRQTPNDREADRLRFSDVVLPYLDDAYGLARWLSGDTRDAEDITQDAMLRAFKGIQQFNGINARAWVLTIVRRACYTWIARNRPTELVALDDEGWTGIEGRLAAHVEPARTPEAEAIGNERRCALTAAVRSLPPPFREVIVLREIHDLSYKEIADILDVDIGTVMSRLARARQALLAAAGEIGR